MKGNLARLALVDLGGVLAGDGGDLVADSQHGVEALFARDVEVVLELLGGQVVAAGLDRRVGLHDDAHRTPSGIGPSRRSQSRAGRATWPE